MGVFEAVQFITDAKFPIRPKTMETPELAISVLKGKPRIVTGEE